MREKEIRMQKMTRLNVIIGIMIVWVFSVTGMTYAATLNTKGELWGCEPQCTVKAVNIKSTTPGKSVYEITGVCYFKPTSGDVACPQAKDTTGIGEWNKQTKQATENLIHPFKGTSSYSPIIKTVSNCPQNPWADPNVKCTLVSKDPSNSKMPGPFPKSAGALTGTQRNAIKQAEGSSGGAYIPTPQAPVIDFPAMGQKFFLPSKIFLQVRHNQAINVSFEFQHAYLSKKVPSIYAKRGLAPANIKTHAGVTTAELNITERGRWRVRAVCNFPGAPWSEWRVFDVE